MRCESGTGCGSETPETWCATVAMEADLTVEIKAVIKAMAKAVVDRKRVYLL